jgi:teichoic acid transport system ATP-binding protein
VASAGPGLANEVAATASPVLVATNVVVTYRVHQQGSGRSLKAMLAHGARRLGPRTVQAVRSVSFTLAEGEALGLVGLNGSGKTSLLRAVAGLTPVTEGRIQARSTPVLLGVGAALNPELSGRRNVYLGGTALGLSRREIEARFDDIVGFAGVSEFIDLPLRAFSAGMSARLRFAIAAAVSPEILLIDEALSVGDAAFAARSQTRMKELVASAGGLILVSHSASSISHMCNRVIWLDNGEVRLDGPTAEVLTEYHRHITAARSDAASHGHGDSPQSRDGGP